MIKIGQPYIEKVNNKTRLCCLVNYDNKDEIIWYEVENKYENCLCDERADAFVVAFLPYAMAFKKDIVIEAAISERLYYQLYNYYIPCLVKYSNYYHDIKITFNRLDNSIYQVNGNAVGTGFSGGVDSFYTILKNIHQLTDSYNITHLTFFKVGATGSFGGEKADKTFEQRVNNFNSIVDEFNLEFVVINSNISEHAKMSFNYIHTFRSISAVLALQKLFKVYYYSSGTTMDQFSFNPNDSANYDFFNMNNFAVEGMQLYSVGLEVNRLDKQRYIQPYDVTYKYLNVCNLEAFNCSKCEKCLRTMVGFHILGTLDRYEKIFDINLFYRHFNKNIGFLIGKSIDGSPEGNADKALIKDMKKYHKHISVISYLIAIPYLIKSLAYRCAKKIKPIKRLYHKYMNKKLGCNYND